jgi:iron complex outermembrane receptor protein
VVLTHDLSVFNRVIDDWIVWFGGSIWTPHNIATVHSRGVETENNLQYRMGKWKLHVGVNTSYVLATTTQSYLPADGSIGKQIPYTPRYNGQGNIGFTWKDLFFNYNHTYTGYRFYTTDESGYIMPYATGNIQLFYTLYIRSVPLQATAQVNNIWNEKYEVVNARPMPGTNWLLGLRASLLN